MADDDVQRRARIAMEPNLDPVVAIVADDVVLDYRFSGSIEVDSVVAVELEKVVAANAALVVDGIAGVSEAVMENVKLASGTDTVVAVLDRESDDFGLRTHRCTYGDDSGIAAIDDRLIDERRVLGGIKLGGQSDRLTGESEVFGVGARGDQNNVPIHGSADGCLYGSKLCRHPEDRGCGDRDRDRVGPV